ncbi:MAG: ABC transporter ATP-binding protein [Candidatus Bathyarchaeia archaeon]
MVEGLSKSFGYTIVLNQLSFKVYEGEVFGLVGPNGAGKTTTIRILSCLIPPSSGSATVAGYDVLSEPEKVRGSVGLLTENPALYERLTPRENLEFYGEAYGLTEPEERGRRIRELLEFFNLWDRRDEKTGHLSKGMKQKLALARAFLHDPPVLLLDEPTSGLDAETASTIRKQVLHLSRERKRTILLSTHRLEDVDRMCSRVLVINGGRGIVIASPEELKRRYGGNPTLHLKLRSLEGSVVNQLRQINGVIDLTVQGMGQVTLKLEDPETTLPEILDSIVRSGGRILSINLTQPTLEETYLKLTSGEQA